MTLIDNTIINLSDSYNLRELFSYFSFQRLIWLIIII